MASVPFELRGSPTDGELARDAMAGLEKVGLAGLLASRGHRAHRARVPGSAAVIGYGWRLVDRWTPTWWPQGVSAAEHEGVPLVITSWFAQVRRGRSQGSRITVVDLRDGKRPRYHHVLLVAPRREHGVTDFDAVRVHAGGMVWSGDRLFVSATFGGIREFRLSDIVRTPSRGILRRASGLFGYRYLLPQVASFEPPGRGRDRMRYSFISLESRVGDDDLRLVAGEYGTDDQLRLARLRLAGGSTLIDEIHVPGIPQMQGAVVHEGTWFVNASRGDKRNGDLWVGTPGAMVRHEGVLPPGPEDLAVWPERGQLWSVTEFPGKRWLFAVDEARWRNDGVIVERGI